MATIKEVKEQIENANALGIANLTGQGVELSANATTYEIMKAISEIVSGSGGGADYTNIVYNEDDTITLTDKDGVEHTMSCTYEDGKLIGVTYDGKAIELTYDGDVLVKVGRTEVDMANAQTSEIELLDHTVTFTVDGEPYEVVSVKDGNSVNAPSVEPTKEGFDGWSLNGNTILFPYTPTEDVELIATFLSLIDTLYDRLNVDKETYPYILIKDNFYDGQHTYEAYVTKQKNLINSSGNFYFTGFYCMRSNTITFDNPDDAPIGVTNILRFIFDNYASTLEKPSGTHNHSVGETCTYYTNTDSKSDIGTWVKI